MNKLFLYTLLLCSYWPVLSQNLEPASVFLLNGETEITYEPLIREPAFFPFEWSLLAGTGNRLNESEIELRAERGNGFERYEGYKTNTTSAYLLLLYYFFRF